MGKKYRATRQRSCLLFLTELGIIGEDWRFNLFYEDTTEDYITHIMLFSKELHEHVFDHYLEETFLVHQMERLQSGEVEGSVEIYWLSMSRVMELALLCAGNYADFGQIREAGDLIVNPRYTEVHIDGIWQPVRVKRYKRMTEQFADYAPAGTNVGEWLRDNTHLVHVKGPLIPDLYDILKGSDTLSESYLSSVYLRMQKISETMTFVMQGQMRDPNYPLSGVIPEEKEFVEANLCRYNRNKFDQLGMDISELLKDEHYCSSFLYLHHAPPELSLHVE